MADNSNDRRVKPDALAVTTAQWLEAARKVHLLRATLANVLNRLGARSVTHDDETLLRNARKVLEDTSSMGNTPKLLCM